MKKPTLIIGVALVAIIGPARADIASVSCVAGGTSNVVQLDISRFGSGVSLLAKTNGLSGTNTVEIANDPPAKPNGLLYVLQPSESSGVTHWIGHDALSEQVGDALSNIAFPVQFVRLNCASVTSGSVTLGVAQAGRKD